MQIQNHRVSSISQVNASSSKICLNNFFFCPQTVRDTPDNLEEVHKSKHLQGFHKATIIVTGRLHMYTSFFSLFPPKVQSFSVCISVSQMKEV